AITQNGMWCVSEALRNRIGACAIGNDHPHSTASNTVCTLRERCPMQHTTATSRPLPTVDPRYAEVVDFMLYEAQLLDDLDEHRWLTELVSTDIEYDVPVRETVERARGTGFCTDTFHLHETYGSLESRVIRGET